MSDKWPDSFTIKSRTWHILYVPKESAALRTEGAEPDDYCLGICRADQRTIWICTDQSHESMQDTIVHELMHACFSTASMAGNADDPEDEEENIVLFATEAMFEIVNNSEHRWWLDE